MAVAVAKSTGEQAVARAAPGGIWAALARAADEPTVGRGDVWRGIERRLVVGRASTATGMWPAVAQRVDPAQYRPVVVPDVAEERLVEGEQTFTVIRSPRGNYLRLTPPQRELWSWMDGTRTVAQLATSAFIQFKQLLPVGDLVTALKHEGFLMDRPVGVYRTLQAAQEARSPEGWGRRVLRLLTGKSWQIQNIDDSYSAIYRAFGWICFTRPFVALWSAVALIGLAAFVLLLLGARDLPVLEAGRSVPLELVALWCALLVSFLLHESAHALAVKHYGRTLRSGGLMLYFGMPAFFVDTSDIWRSPRQARIIVSAAGPMSDLFVGGLAALLVLLLPDAALSSVAYKLAFTCYIATLFNANPLLELDGYFILVDLLRLPDLRRRALAFVRGPLWKKLRERVSLQREERIFTLYGALTLLYSVVAIGFAVQFWRQHLWGTIQTLWESGAPLQRVVAAVLFLLVVVPLLSGLVFAGWGVVLAVLNWVLRRGYGRQPALLTAVSIVLVLALTWLASSALGAQLAAGAVAATESLPYRAGEVVTAVLWAVALGALWTVRPDYRGAAIGPTLNALLLTTALAGLGAIARALHLPPSFGMAADGLAFVFLVVGGFAGLLDVDLRLASPRELLLTALLLMLAFGVGGVALFGALEWWRDTHPGIHIALAAPAYFGALALALLLPRLFDLRDSRLVWSWNLLWGATLVQTAAYVANVGGRAHVLDVLAAGLWASAWLVHLATLRQIAPDEMHWPHEASMSEQQRLTRAFQFCYAGCYRLLRAVYGARRTKALDDRMDVLAATANWDVTLDRDHARINTAVLALPLDTQGARYAEVLRYTVATIQDIAGATFARRAIQASYDALPWPERETASRLCFPDTPWARELSSAFGDVRAGRLRLLRQVDMFLNCDDDELGALVHSMNEQDAAAGEVLLRRGTPAPGLWVIEAGEVIATRAGQVVAELHRGDSFGARELLEEHDSDMTYRAAITSSLLFIPAAEFKALVQGRAPHAAEGLDAAETLRLLERVPMFADMPRNTLRGLALIARRQQFAPRSVIVRQGYASGVFYIIKQGRAAVLARGVPQASAPPKVRQVAQLGPEEFFGELELLRGTPPLASVVAITPMVVLALPHAALQALTMGDGGVARGLEQIGTGRLIALRGQVGSA